MPLIDWYDRRDELECEQVFTSCYGIVKLDRRVPGDGTQWYVASMSDSGWAYWDDKIEPSDLIERLPDDTKTFY